MHLPPDDEIVMVAGIPPIRAKKARYFEDARFRFLVCAPPVCLICGRLRLREGARPPPPEGRQRVREQGSLPHRLEPEQLPGPTACCGVFQFLSGDGETSGRAGLSSSDQRLLYAGNG